MNDQYYNYQIFSIFKFSPTFCTQGVNLNINVLNFAPYSYKVELKKGSKKHYEFEGWFKEILLELKDSLNFSYTVTKPSDGNWGSLNSDGTWTGMIGGLHRREIDLGNYFILQ